MNFKTPKSTKYSETQSPSPRKGTPKSKISSKQSSSIIRQKILEQQSAQSSLIVKLIEAKISSEDQYQNLLIKNKQLEIKILQLQEQAQTLKKSFKKVSKPLQQIKAKIQSSKLSLVEKQKYLEKFYIHLDNRLKSNMHSNLFGKLQKIQIALEDKYQQQKQTLYSGLASQHQYMEAANQKLLRLKQYRDELIKQYTQRVMDSQNRTLTNQTEFNKNSESKKSNKSKSQKRSANNASSKKSHEQKILQKAKQQAKNKEKEQRKKRKQQKKAAKLSVKNQCERLKENILVLKKEKQMAEKDQKLLKQLLNIQEQHKKHSVYIISGYKKMFTIQYRHMISSRKKSPASRSPSPDNTIVKSQAGSSLKQSQKSELYQSAVSMPDVEGLQKLLSQRQAERGVLQRQVEQRNAALQKCKQRLNEDIGEYSRLEEQIMRISNRNIGISNRQTNHRMTYAENQNRGNHRSTYTSYQQRSDHLDEDL